MLLRIGVPHLVEYVTPDGLFSVDIALRNGAQVSLDSSSPSINLLLETPETCCLHHQTASMCAVRAAVSPAGGATLHYVISDILGLPSSRCCKTNCD